MSASTKTNLAEVLPKVYEECLLNDQVHALDLIDLDYIEGRIREFKEAFPEDFVRNFYCVKVNSFSKIVGIFLKNGMGAECASIPEVAHALKLGAKPEHVAYYAPCRSKVNNNYMFEINSFISFSKFQK